jgi:hypothetical protein
VRPPYRIVWDWFLYPEVSAVDGHQARASTIPTLEPVLPNNLKGESESKYQENDFHELFVVLTTPLSKLLIFSTKSQLQ